MKKEVQSKVFCLWLKEPFFLGQEDKKTKFNCFSCFSEKTKDIDMISTILLAVIVGHHCLEDGTSHDPSNGWEFQTLRWCSKTGCSMPVLRTPSNVDWKDNVSVPVLGVSRIITIWTAVNQGFAVVRLCAHLMKQIIPPRLFFHPKRVGCSFEFGGIFRQRRRTFQKLGRISWKFRGKSWDSGGTPQGPCSVFVPTRPKSEMRPTMCSKILPSARTYFDNYKITKCKWRCVFSSVY